MQSEMKHKNILRLLSLFDGWHLPRTCLLQSCVNFCAHKSFGILLANIVFDAFCVYVRYVQDIFAMRHAARTEYNTFLGTNISIGKNTLGQNF